MADERDPRRPPPNRKGGSSPARKPSSGARKPPPASRKPSAGAQPTSGRLPRAKSRAEIKAEQDAAAAERAALARRRSDAAASAAPPGPAQPWERVATVTPASGTVIRVQERLDEKRKAETRARWSKVGVRLAMVGAAAAVLWAILLSPLFALDKDKVGVTGLGTAVDPLMVEAVIAVHDGTSLALLNTGHVANQLRELPGVRDASIERVWPAGLSIEITAREPVAAIPDPAGGYVLLDDEAFQVGRVETAPANLPVVVVPLGEGSERVLDAVLGVINELPVDLRDRVANIRAETEDSVSFELRDGPRVEWGSAEQSALKAQVLQVMLESQQAAGAAVIDVSAPTLPITRSE